MLLNGDKRKTIEKSRTLKKRTAAVYRRLPPGLRKLVRGLWMRLYGKPLLSDTEKLLQDLNFPLDEGRDGKGSVLTAYMYAYWRSRPDIRAAWPLDNPEDRRAYAEWFVHFANKDGEMDSRLLPRLDDCPPGLNQSAGTIPEKGTRAGDRTGARKVNPKVKGVNVIGHARAESGLGEDVRMTVRALTEAGVDFSVYNHHHRLLSSQGDDSLETYLDSELPHNVNLFHLPLPEIVGAFGRLGPEAFSGRYNIGYCMWELPRCPDIWSHAGEFVDEIWTPTRFVRDSHAQGISKPVLHIPYPVWLDPPENCERREFGLPEEAYIFLFIFDFLGNIHRKNPLACIEAFKLAFPDKKTAVRLVVKSMNGWPWDRTWQKMKRAIGNDNRIMVVNQTFDRRRLLRLIKVCDCYLSLHRSEGFGRGMAEAMFMGKPVVATAYSGNADFTNTKNSLPVNYKVIPVEPGEHPFGEGQVWAEPDIDQAALHLRRLAAQPGLGVELGKKARGDIMAGYNPLVVGRHYKSRLGRLGLI